MSAEQRSVCARGPADREVIAQGRGDGDVLHREKIARHPEARTDARLRRARGPGRHEHAEDFPGRVCFNVIGKHQPLRVQLQMKILDAERCPRPVAIEPLGGPIFEQRLPRSRERRPIA